MLYTLLLAATGGAAGALAQDTRSPGTASIYTCRDASGRTLSSDRPIPECSSRVMRELSPSGHLRREIEAPPTPEQIRQREQAEQRRLLQVEQQRLAEARDRALLMTYGNLHSLEASRKRQLADLQRDIGIVEARLTASGKELESAKAELAAAGTQASPAAQRRVEDVSRVLSADAYRLSKLRTEEIRLNERFDDDAQRLRTLLGEPAQQPAERPAVRQTSTGDGR
ncbi:MAG TPA: DUF4124 domain-containing protein [Burkholderiaceae bacterium]|nr:DUF4124 domain-containing protein [Burkholderiaceae bacterium]